jgi:hypothetical protein
MERELNFESPRHDNLNPGEPHFNDERTLQTARPVVPLTVFSRILTKRRVGLAVAFVLAALLGAGAALTIIRLRQPETTKLLEASEREENNEPVVSGVAAAETEPSPQVNEVETTEPTPPQRPARLSQRPRAVEPERSAPTVTIAIEPNESRPQARLVDEWQERRQRRVIRPERQNNHHKRDLFRIREIFEGPRRRSQ